VYAALEAREPRPYLLQHQTANDNWTQTFASLGEAKAAADGVGHDPQARQEISFFDTGEGWIRAGSRMEWMYRGPIRERAISDGTSSLLGDFVS
jgi:hypothetical protein